MAAPHGMATSTNGLWGMVNQHYEVAIMYRVISHIYCQQVDT